MSFTVISFTEDSDGSIDSGSEYEMTSETFDDIPDYNLTNQETESGYLSSDDSYEFEENEDDVITDEFPGDKDNLISDYEGHEDKLMIGKDDDVGDPTAHYKFEDDAGNTIEDSSIHGNDADVYGSGEHYTDDGIYRGQSHYLDEEISFGRDYPSLFNHESYPEESFGLDFWVKPDSSTPGYNEKLFSHNNSASNTSLEIRRDLSSDNDFVPTVHSSWENYSNFDDISTEENDINALEYHDDVIYFGTDNETFGYDVGKDEIIYTNTDVSDVLRLKYHDGYLYYATDDMTCGRMELDLDVDWEEEVGWLSDMDVSSQGSGGSMVVSGTQGVTNFYLNGTERWESDYDSIVPAYGVSLSQDDRVLVGNETGYVTSLYFTQGNIDWQGLGGDSYDTYLQGIDYHDGLLFLGYGDWHNGDDGAWRLWDLDDDSVVTWSHDPHTVTHMEYNEDTEEFIWRDKHDDGTDIHRYEVEEEDGNWTHDKIETREFDDGAFFHYDETSLLYGDSDGVIEPNMREWTEQFDVSFNVNEWNYLMFGSDDGNLYATMINDDESVEFSRDWDVEYDWDSTGHNSPSEFFSGYAGYVDRVRTFPKYNHSDYYDDYTTHITDAVYEGSNVNVVDDYYNSLEIDVGIGDVDFDTFYVALIGDDNETILELDDLDDGTNTVEFEPDFKITDISVYFDIDEDVNLNTGTPFLDEVHIYKDETASTEVRREPSSDSPADGVFNYRMIIEDGMIGGNVSANLDWFTASDNISDFGGSYIPISSLNQIQYALKIEQITESGDASDNLIYMESHERYHDENGSLERTESDVEYTQDDLTEGYWKNLDTNVFGIYDSAGISINVETHKEWTGTIVIDFDYVRYTVETSEVYPKLFNEFTGEGLQQDRLVVQYKDMDGNWRITSGESFLYIQRTEVEIRAMDYWGQVVWNDTFVPNRVEELVRIPIPIIDLETRPPHYDEPRWEFRTPWFSISSATTGESKEFNSWDMEVVGGRQYEFAWSGMEKYLSGSQLVDLSYHLDEPIFDFNSDSGSDELSMEMSTTSLSTEDDDEYDGGVETEDDSVSSIKGGKAIVDLEMNIDPEASVGRPPLYLNPVEFLGGDSEHWKYFPKHQATAMLYDVFMVEYYKYNPYRDGWIKYFQVLFSSPIFVVFSAGTTIMVFAWYVEVIKGGIVMNSEKVPRNFKRIMKREGES